MTKNNSVKREKLSLKEVVAMGVGGMVGGGIFSVLGLSASLAGHAAPIAFALGSIIAFLTGHAYNKLGLCFRSDGGSFTYLEQAFKQRNVAGLGGWLLLVGYIGTMALYAYTFGVYGKAVLGTGAPDIWQRLLASLILLLFLAVNLVGAKASGRTETLLVGVKVVILGVFAVAGLFSLKSDHVLPLFNQGTMGVVIGAALIFVAYEGFELIPNAVNEMENPRVNMGRAIMISIAITTVIYIFVSLVAVGNLSAAEITKYQEDALAVAAQPSLGQFGFTLIGLGALLSTASAINATMFGTARLGMAMAQDEDLPKVFSYTERTKDIPWVSMVVITAVTLLFVNIADLTIISSFASSTFLLIFAAINLSAWRLRRKIGIDSARPLLGLLLTLGSWVVLMGYLWQNDRNSLIQIGIFYLVVITAELLFSKRAWFYGRKS